MSSADKAAAEKLKNEGNAFLTAGKYSLAVERYSAALALHPSNAIYLANRAAAYINMSQYAKAEADCRASIAVDPSYGKAHYRLGQALLQQQRPSDAIAAFERALQHIDASMRDTIQEQLDAARAAEAKQHAGHDEDEDEDLLSDGADGAPGAGGMDFNAILNNPMFAQLASQARRRGRRGRRRRRRRRGFQRAAQQPADHADGRVPCSVERAAAQPPARAAPHPPPPPPPRPLPARPRRRASALPSLIS